jgi:hypothetical protein
MFKPWICPGGQHLPPATGGSCPCGMVTRIPAPKRPAAGLPPEVLAMLAQCLDEGSQALEAAVAELLRERADRLMAALTSAGLVLSAGDAERLGGPRIEAAQLAALAYTSPRVAAVREVVTPALESAPATLAAGVDSACSELDARRAKVVDAATASTRKARKAAKKARKKAGKKHPQFGKAAVVTARTVKGKAGVNPERGRLLAA